MSLAIVGMGWVTPLGSGLDSVWERLLQGEEASATTVSEEFVRSCLQRLSAYRNQR